MWVCRLSDGGLEGGLVSGGRREVQRVRHELEDRLGDEWNVKMMEMATLMDAAHKSALKSAVTSKAKCAPQLKIADKTQK